MDEPSIAHVLMINDRLQVTIQHEDEYRSLEITDGIGTIAILPEELPGLLQALEYAQDVKPCQLHG